MIQACGTSLHQLELVGERSELRGDQRVARGQEGLDLAQAFEHPPISSTWWSSKRPISDSVNSGFLFRSFEYARSAITTGVLLAHDQRAQHGPRSRR